MWCRNTGHLLWRELEGHWWKHPELVGKKLIGRWGQTFFNLLGWKWMSKTCLGGNPSPLLASLQRSRHAWAPSALGERLWETHGLTLLPKAGGVNILPALGCISIRSRDSVERPCSQSLDLWSQPGLRLAGCPGFLAFSIDLTFFSLFVLLIRPPSVHPESLQLGSKTRTMPLRALELRVKIPICFHVKGLSSDKV